MKPLPPLADRFLAERIPARDRIIHPRAVEQLRRSVRNAHRFVFDEEATRRVARVVATIPDLIVREHQFARAPFDLTWIEYPAYTYILEMREAVGHELHHEVDLTADHTVGYLIDHNRINVIAGGTVSKPDDKSLVVPIQYHLHTEWPLDQQLEFTRLIGANRMTIDQFFWGYSYNMLSDEDRRMLRAYNKAESMPLNLRHPYAYKYAGEDGRLGRYMIDAAGELRTVIALLLMLNRPTVTRFTNHFASRGFYRAKHIPFMAHSTVTVDLDAVRTIRLVGTPEGDSVPRRRHEVRGHYCHDKAAHDYQRIAGCIHEWRATDEEWNPVELPEDERMHWRCTACGGKRWWRAHHERGDASLGWVSASHKVTERQDREVRQ